MPLCITIDTREQRPWSFPGEVATVTRGTLTAGDYALTGDTRFAIERKSLSDFAGTVSSGWPRFQRELDRMRELAYPARVVVVEGTLGDLLNGLEQHPKLSPAFYFKRVAELTMAGVTVLFAHDDAIAAGITTVLLRQRAYDLGWLDGQPPVPAPTTPTES